MKTTNRIVSFVVLGLLFLTSCSTLSTEIIFKVYFILTPRGSSLLSLIDSAIPGERDTRQVLDEQVDALDEATFEKVASQAAIAGGAI